MWDGVCGYVKLDLGFDIWIVCVEGTDRIWECMDGNNDAEHEKMSGKDTNLQVTVNETLLCQLSFSLTLHPQHPNFPLVYSTPPFQPQHSNPKHHPDFSQHSQKNKKAHPRTSMATTTEHALAHPLMLNDFTADMQRLSASLHPDDWDEGAPTPLLKRQASGFFELVSYYTRDPAEDSQLMGESVKPSMHGQDTAQTGEREIEERPGWLMRVFRHLWRCLGR